ncbi:putative translation initiation inhibitor, yjgF family [Actinoalloteichus hymeniacidonis]|uniref:Translation initiation inhibitor, yjgF family n=2 Tax=Actinoalloteichus hymeniacidonis TaxID=340345 RepID=A0AAC9HQK9_9PSEU|nr:putative translation initiation inhibitor, yjgF family [Actinoalloteichus hymeniacidonis]
MPHVITNPTELHDPTAFGYSHVVEAPTSGLVFISGQYASDVHGDVVSTDFATQVEKAFANLGTALAAVGLGFGDVVRLGSNIVDHDAERFNALLPVLTRIWGDRPPAHTLVGVAKLAMPGMLFEVEATAVRS